MKRLFARFDATLGNNAAATYIVGYDPDHTTLIEPGRVYGVDIVHGVYWFWRGWPTHNNEAAGWYFRVMLR